MDTPGGSRSTTSVEVSNPDANPDKLDHAAEPRVGYAEVGKVEIYYEVRGSGIPVLMIGAATEDAEALRVRVDSAVHEHLRSHPDDWAGATEELGRAAASSLPDTTNLFSAPPDKEWFARRTGDNAESLIRGGGLPLTRERFEPDAVARSPVDLRFAYGTASHPIFKQITSRLATMRDESPDAIEGMGHLAFYQPEAITSYIRNWT